MLISINNISLEAHLLWQLFSGPSYKLSLSLKIKIISTGVLARQTYNVYPEGLDSGGLINLLMLSFVIVHT